MRVGDDDDRKKKLANILKAQKFCGDCFPAKKMQNKCINRQFANLSHFLQKISYFFSIWTRSPAFRMCIKKGKKAKGRFYKKICR